MLQLLPMYWWRVLELSRSLSLLLALGLGACVSPAPQEFVVFEGRWELRLPAKYGAWESILLNELHQMEELYQEDAARWRVAKARPLLKIWVAADILEAQVLADRAALEGSSEVARTHPRQGIALIPLPRNDDLLSRSARPPSTWLQTFRHEAAHLLSLERNSLRNAPSWFQEGYAESWAEGPPSAWPSGGPISIGTAWGGLFQAAMVSGAEQVPALDFLETMPAEVRLGGWRALARLSMRETPDQAPWEYGRSWTAGALMDAMPAGFTDRLPIGRGRELGWNPSAGDYLLVSYPARMVNLEAGKWTGSVPLEVSMQVGRTGNAEAGLLLKGSGGRRLRVRCNVFGALVAYTEEDNLEVAAFQGPAPVGLGAGEARHFKILLQRNHLRIEADGYRRRFPLGSAPHPPYEVELYVRDGALAANLQGLNKVR